MYFMYSTWNSSGDIVTPNDLQGSPRLIRRKAIFVRYSAERKEFIVGPSFSLIGRHQQAMRKEGKVGVCCMETLDTTEFKTCLLPRIKD